MVQTKCSQGIELNKNGILVFVIYKLMEVNICNLSMPQKLCKKKDDVLPSVENLPNATFQYLEEPDLHFH